MKTKGSLFVLIFLLGLALAPSADARNWYLGLKGGGMTSEISGMSKAVSIGLLAGSEIWQLAYGSLALEGEATTTIDAGEVSTAEFFSGQWSVDTLGLLLAYRSPTRLFGKARVGLNYVKSKITGAGNNFSDSTGGISLGLGGGWRINDFLSLEAEYTHEAELSLAGDKGNIGFWSLGLICHF